jgi:hypothetical protein
MVVLTPAAGIWVPEVVPTGTWVLCGIFGVVSAILVWLFAVSRGWIEKLYFGMCTVSASSGLLRTAFGDQAFHAGIYIRVVMLASAVLVGLVIVRIYAQVRINDLVGVDSNTEESNTATVGESADFAS